jgi:long-chain acyl-CoA synthetase
MNITGGAMKLADENLPLQRVYQWEQSHPHHIYLSQPMGDGVMRDYSWSQVVAESGRMAAYLQSLGYAPGSCVAILSKNSAHWIMSDLAIWMAGYVSVPLYPTLTAESIRQILVHSESRACFVGKLDGWEAMKPGIPEGVQCISHPLSPPNNYPTWDAIVARTAPLQGRPVRKGDDIATIVYTSGTTGMPKGVVHTFANIGWVADALYQRLVSNGLSPAGPQDRMLSYLPLSHVAERWVVESSSFRSGFRIYFANFLETFAEDIRRARPTLFISVPRLWVKFQQGVLAKMPPKKLERLLRIPLLNRIIKKKILQGLGLEQCRFAGGGAAPMPPAMLAWFGRVGLEVLEGYGMTENFGCSHSALPGQVRSGYVGTPYPGVEQRIDPETGEIQMRSPALMLGYFKEPQKTAEVMTADGWFRTGDKGEIDKQGRLKITGRVKDLFKTSKGKYVAPAPIEDRLVTNPAIEACCVAGANFGQPFGILMLSAIELEKLKGKVAERQHLNNQFEAHLESINAQLDPHEQMDFLAVVGEQWTVENGFITPTLKIKRNAVEHAYGPHFESWLKQKKPVVWHGF